jgi:hypothetical protein
MSEELPHDFENLLREQQVIEATPILLEHGTHEARHVHGAECDHHQAGIHIDHMENVAEENHSHNHTHESAHVHSPGCGHVEHENAHDHIDKTHIHNKQCGHVHHHDAKKYIDSHETHTASHNHEKHEAQHVHSSDCGHVKHENAQEHIDKPHVHTEACGHLTHHEARQHIDVARKDIPNEHHQEAQEHIHAPGCGYVHHDKAHEHINHDPHNEELTTPLEHIHAERDSHQIDAAIEQLNLERHHPTDTLMLKQEFLAEPTSAPTAELTHMQHELAARLVEETRVKQIQTVMANESIPTDDAFEATRINQAETQEDTFEEPNLLIATTEGTSDCLSYEDYATEPDDHAQVPIAFSDLEPSTEFITDITPAEATEAVISIEQTEAPRTATSVDALTAEMSSESRPVQDELPELSALESMLLSGETVVEPIPTLSEMQLPPPAKAGENGKSDVLEETVNQLSFPEKVPDSGELAAPEMIAALEHILEVITDAGESLAVAELSKLEEQLLAFGHYLKPADRLELLRDMQNEEINEIITMLERLLEQTKAGIYQEYAVTSRFTLPTEDDQTSVSLLGKLVLKLLRSNMVIPIGQTA